MQKIIVLLLSGWLLSGCAIVALGAGAAGGYYVAQRHSQEKSQAYQQGYSQGQSQPRGQMYQQRRAVPQGMPPQQAAPRNVQPQTEPVRVNRNDFY